MNGRRVYHARGKVLGGSSSINGMIFQRGNPIDYERWAGRQGHGELGLRALPAVLQADGDLPRPAADAWRGGSGPLVLERGPATNPLFGAFFEAAQQAGYPLTDDVNGYRQEGFARFDRNVHRGRRLSAARAYLHPVMGRPNLDVETLAMVTGMVTRRQPGHRRRLPPRRPRHRHGAGRRGRSSAAARSTPRSCCCSRASARRPTSRRSASRGRRPARRRRATCRTTSRSTSSTPPSSPSRSRPGSSTGTSPASAPSGCSCAAASAPPTTSRPAASSAATTTSTTRT